MSWGIWLNLLLCFFNLIPIPPLDGSHLLYHVAAPGLGARYRELGQFGYLPLMVLLSFLQPVHELLPGARLTGAAELLFSLIAGVRHRRHVEHLRRMTPPAAPTTALGAEPAFVVQLDAFSGPLDLLLHLLREEQIDIADIPIARIADQFLQRDPRAGAQPGGRLPGDGGPAGAAQGADAAAAPRGRGRVGGSAARAGAAAARVPADPGGRRLAGAGRRAAGRPALPRLPAAAARAAAAAARRSTCWSCSRRWRG